MPGVRQTSFASGELSPLLWGRTDLPLYRHGLRRLRDFFVTRQGMAMSRPGTRYLGTLADSTTGAWLLPFTVSDGDGYLLELGWNGDVRAWRNGAVVWTSSAPFVVAGARAPGAIQYVQSGDVMTFANRGRIYELRRTSASSFSWAVMSFARVPGEWVRLPDGAPTTGPLLLTSTLLGATSTSPARPWRWWMTCLMRDSAGRFVESDAFEAVQVVSSTGVVSAYGGSAAVGPDRPVTIRRATSGAVWSGTRLYEVVGFNYYRGVGEFSGFIGHSTTELDFVDDGREPDYTLPRPRASDPFVYSIPSSAPVQDYPYSVAYFEDRLAFGGTIERPNNLLISASGDYIDFNRQVVPVDSAAIEVELAVRRRESIRALLGGHRLLAFTDAGVWAIGSDAALSPTTVGARLVAEVGSAWLRPLQVGNDALYVRNKGVGLRLLRPSENAVGLFSSGDLSWQAEHLFHGFSTAGSPIVGADTGVGPIVDWCWQEDPWNLVWLVRGDGKLISLQWDGQEAAYSLHSTGTADRFEAVCSVPEGDEDVVYVVTNRGGTYCLERLASRVRRQTVDDDCCVDCASQKTVATGSPVISGLPAVLEGRAVYVVATDNAPIGPMTVTAGAVDLAAAGFRLPTANNGANVTCWVGLLFQPELELLDVVTPDTRMNQRSVVKVAIEVADSKGLAVGQTVDALEEWRQRRPSDAFGVPSMATEVVDLPVRGSWDNGGRAVLRQVQPLPLTVLGVTREVDFGG